LIERLNAVRNETLMHISCTSYSVISTRPQSLRLSKLWPNLSVNTRHM